MIAYGHTHLPEISREGETWILNPGSPTERRRAPEHTLIVLEGGKPALMSLSA
jgi:predicted phosphodiesterase